MIDRIRGKLLSVEPDRVVLECGPIDVEVAIPACDVAALQTQVGTNLSLHTVFQIDSPVNGTVATPKLIGFVEASTRSFYRALVGVKGMGGRKALRALAQPTQEIAAAILGNDIKALTTLAYNRTRSRFVSLRCNEDDSEGEIEYDEYERVGLTEVRDCCFVLVAGGLGIAENLHTALDRLARLAR